MSLNAENGLNAEKSFNAEKSLNVEKGLNAEKSLNVEKGLNVETTMAVVRLRAMEPEDLDALYRIENDRDVWDVGENNVPYSRYILHDYIARYLCRQAGAHGCGERRRPNGGRCRCGEFLSISRKGRGEHRHLSRTPEKRLRKGCDKANYGVCSSYASSPSALCRCA